MLCSCIVGVRLGPCSNINQSRVRSVCFRELCLKRDYSFIDTSNAFLLATLRTQSDIFFCTFFASAANPEIHWFLKIDA